MSGVTSYINLTIYICQKDNICEITSKKKKAEKETKFNWVQSSIFFHISSTIPQQIIEEEMLKDIIEVGKRHECINSYLPKTPNSEWI